MIPPEALARLRQVADLDVDDVAAWTAIGSTSAAAILADVDTLAAVRAYLSGPAPNLARLRALLAAGAVETLDLRADHAARLDR